MKKTTIIALCLGALLLSGTPALAANTPDGAKLAGGMTNAAATAAVLAIMAWCGPGRPMPSMPAAAATIPMNMCHHKTVKAKKPERNPEPPKPPDDPDVSHEQSSHPQPPKFLDATPKRPQGGSGTGNNGGQPTGDGGKKE